MERDNRALTESDLRQVDSKQLVTLGAVGRTYDERYFRYCGIGSSAVGAGLLVITPAVVANHTNISVASTSNTAIGSMSVDVTLGNTAATQDQYAEATFCNHWICWWWWRYHEVPATQSHHGQ